MSACQIRFAIRTVFPRYAHGIMHYLHDATTRKLTSSSIDSLPTGPTPTTPHQKYRHGAPMHLPPHLPCSDPGPLPAPSPPPPTEPPADAPCPPFPGVPGGPPPAPTPVPDPGILLDVLIIDPPPTPHPAPDPPNDPAVPGGPPSAPCPLLPATAAAAPVNTADPGVRGRSAAMALTLSWEPARAAVKRLASAKELVLPKAPAAAAEAAASSTAALGLRSGGATFFCKEGEAALCVGASVTMSAQL